ncbi:CCHC-type domain-containing protein [Trichonephila clavipes]|nr:CCHC-type domain-containing protein [Trichonephila clavipes]
MSLPNPVEQKSHDVINNKLSRVMKEVAEESMKMAAVEENSSSPDNLLTVSGDGTWKTRGHSSLIDTDDEPMHWFCPTNPNTWSKNSSNIQNRHDWQKKDAQTILVTPTVLAESRKTTIFGGEPGQDPIKWMKEYQKVLSYNRWDDTMQLAKACFFLDVTARKWYENNEDNFTSWTLLENGLKAAFGDTQTYVRRERDRLREKSRAQQPEECIQSYIQDVLELCKQAKPNMSEGDKVSHLMKGVTEDLFQALLARDVQTS